MEERKGGGRKKEMRKVSMDEKEGGKVEMVDVKERKEGKGKEESREGWR